MSGFITRRVKLLNNVGLYYDASMIILDYLSDDYIGKKNKKRKLTVNDKKYWDKKINRFCDLNINKGRTYIKYYIDDTDKDIYLLKKIKWHSLLLADPIQSFYLGRPWRPKDFLCFDDDDVYDYNIRYESDMSDSTLSYSIYYQYDSSRFPYLEIFLGI